MLRCIHNTQQWSQTHDGVLCHGAGGLQLHCMVHLCCYGGVYVYVQCMYVPLGWGAV